MKLMKKSLSIVLSILMLASVCTVLMTSSVSAYSYTNKTLVAHDFEDSTGVAQWTPTEKFPTGSSSLPHLAGQAKWGAEYTADPEDPDNTVFYMWNKAYNGFSMQIGKKGANGGGEDDALSLEDGKQYTLTFKYKIAAGSGGANYSSEKGFYTAVSMTVYKGSQLIYKNGDKKSLGDAFFKSLTLEDDNVKSFDTQTAVKEGLGEFERLGYINDTEWMTASVDLTGDAAKDNIFLTISAGSIDVLGGNGLVDTFVGIYLDNIVIRETSGAATEMVATGTYVYDFKDEAGTYMTAFNSASTMTDYTFGKNHAGASEDCHAWFSYSDEARADVFGSGSVAQSFIQPGQGAVLVTNGLATDISAASGTWSTKLYLKDPDFKLGDGSYGFLRMEAGNYYRVEAYIKSYSGKAVDGVTDVSNSANFKAGICISSCNVGSSNNTIGAVVTKDVDYKKTDATVISAVLDADDTSWLGVSNSTSHQTNVGRYIGITAQSKCYVLVEKVVVTVYSKANMIDTVGYSSVDMENGWADMYFPNGNAMGLGNIAITDDPTNAGQGKVFNFNSKGTLNSTMTYGIAAEAGLGGFSGDGLDTYAKGFQVEAGHRYRITFKAYVSEAYTSNFPEKFGIYQTEKDAISKYVAGHKTGVVSTCLNDANHMATIKSRIGTGVWTDVVLEFVTDKTAYDKGQTYLLLSHGVNLKNEGASCQFNLYLDDITVTDVTYNTGDVVENAKRSIRAAEGTGENYISAGLRFRGELKTADIEGKQVGFIVAPIDYVASYNGADKWYTITNGKAALGTAKVVNATNVVYGTNGDYTQYQLILTNLTQENVDKNLLATQFNVKMYIKDGDTYTYYDVATSSYNQVKNAYAIKDASALNKY